jgi:hypothetical protein
LKALTRFIVPVETRISMGDAQFPTIIAIADGKRRTAFTLKRGAKKVSSGKNRTYIKVD